MPAVIVGLCACQPLAAQEGIGRLFTTLSERSALNQLRLEAQFAQPQQEETPAPQPEARVAEADQGPAVSRLEINGIVRRSGGPSTVWVNGAQVERGRVSREGLMVQAGRRARDGVRVELPSGLRTVRLKPGQAIDVTTGTLVDAFEARPDEDAASAFEPLPDAAPGTSVPGLAGAVPAPGAEAALEADEPPLPSGGLTPAMRARLAGMSPAERAAAIHALRAVGVVPAPPGTPPTRGAVPAQ
jgi:hypothetical protein